jgi:ribulose-5-phosphate 4-epimerase/fuculose-1-phosphate aldolase
MNVDLGARLNDASMKEKVSEAEWQARCDLAACYRLVDHFGYNSGAANHITARVPDEPDHFLINPGLRLFGEITASCLVKIDMDGNIKQDDAPTGIVNPAGHVIHSAVLMARPEINCVVHLHTIPGVTVSSLKEGLKFYCQESFRFYGRVGYHDYEGIARDFDERDRLAADLGDDNNCLVLRNHGSLVVGRSIPEAFTLTMSFEKACAVQIAARQTGQELVEVPHEVAEKTSKHRASRNLPIGEPAWVCWKRMADAYYPSYMN